MARHFHVIVASALLALAPCTARCGNVVTNATDLLPCLGYGGKAGVDFLIEGTVVWGSTPLVKNFFVKTRDGYMKLADKALWPDSFPREGDIVRARGRTFSLKGECFGGFVNADCLEIDVLGHVTPEPPLDTTVDDVLSGRHLFRPVRICGTVRDVFADEIDHLYIHIIISSGEKAIGLALPTQQETYDPLAKLVGAEVRATGCYTPIFSGFRRLSKSEIGILSTNNIEITVPPPQDPFDVPSVKSISVDETAKIANLGRHSAKGVVVAVWQRLNFAIRAPDGAIANVSLAYGPPPACGDMVEVAGLPETDLYRINLRRAIWRLQPGTERQAPEAATPVDIAAIFTDGHGHDEFNPNFHAKAISLRGMVAGLPSAGMDDGIVRLQCGDLSMTVDSSATPDAIKDLEPGCEAEISGACIVKADSWRPNEPMPRIREVVLVVRAPSDVKVLVPPPWWTPGRFMVLIAALLAVLAAVTLWNAMLRRLAEKRGRELMQSKLTQVESQMKVQERTRIAVELHDTIAQNLTGVSLEIDSAVQLAAKDKEGMMKHLGMAALTLQSCRNELRNCLWDLRSRALEEADLNEAIRRTIAPLVPEVGLSIRFNVKRKALTDDTAHVLMRIVRELALNAVRHGEATSVKIAGSLDGGVLRFSVSDNGRGFDPKTCPGVSQGHFGLNGIRERINQFNGSMTIDSAPGKGAKATVTLNIRDDSGNP